MPILEPDDFENGVYAVAIDEHTFDDLEKYIEFVERDTLKSILGVKLYKDFVDEVDLGGGVPTTQRFLDFVNGVFYNNTNYGADKWFEPIGAEEILKAFTYRKYVDDTASRHTTAGEQEVDASNSSGVFSSKGMVAYNQGVSACNESYVFLQFYQEVKTDVVSFTENAGVYTITVGTGEVFYIFPTLEIDIDGTTYTVDSIDTPNNQLDFTATTGLTISGTITYNPFPDWDGKLKHFSTIF